LSPRPKLRRQIVSTLLYSSSVRAHLEFARFLCPMCRVCSTRLATRNTSKYHVE